MNFQDKSIAELAEDLPSHCLSPASVEQLGEQVAQLQRKFELFSPEQASVMAGFTSSYVKYTSPDEVSQDIVETMGAYLFVWFWINTRKEPDDLGELLRVFPRIMQGHAVGSSHAIVGPVTWLASRWKYRENQYRFLASFGEMVCSMRWELKNKGQCSLSAERYDRVRTHSIGTQAWFDGWRLLRGLPPPVDYGAEIGLLEYLCRRQQYLANDLCSVERDINGRGANLALLLHQEGNTSLAECVAKVERFHDQTREEILSLWRSLESTDLSAEERWYTRFLLTCTAGNALGMEELRGYYRRVMPLEGERSPRGSSDGPSGSQKII